MFINLIKVTSQKGRWLKSNPPPLDLFTLEYYIFIRLMAMSLNDRVYFHLISNFNSGEGRWGFWLTLVIVITFLAIQHGNKLLFCFTVFNVSRLAFYLTPNNLNYVYRGTSSCTEDSLTNWYIQRNTVPRMFTLEFISKRWSSIFRYLRPAHLQNI